MNVYLEINPVEHSQTYFFFCIGWHFYSFPEWKINRAILRVHTGWGLSDLLLGKYSTYFQVQIYGMVLLLFANTSFHRNRKMSHLVLYPLFPVSTLFSSVLYNMANNHCHFERQVTSFSIFNVCEVCGFASTFCIFNMSLCDILNSHLWCKSVARHKNVSIIYLRSYATSYFFLKIEGEYFLPLFDICT